MPRPNAELHKHKRRKTGRLVKFKMHAHMSTFDAILNIHAYNELLQ